MRGRGGATRHARGLGTIGPRGRGLGSTMGPRGRGVPVARRTRFAMGDDVTTPTLQDPTAEIVANTRAILAAQREEAANRRIGYIIAGASALFAAAKFGLVAIPLIRKKREP